MPEEIFLLQTNPQNDVTHLDGTLKLSLFAFRLPGSGLKSQLPLQYAKLAYEMCNPVTWLDPSGLSTSQLVKRAEHFVWDSGANHILQQNGCYIIYLKKKKIIFHSCCIHLMLYTKTCAENRHLNLTTIITLTMNINGIKFFKLWKLFLCIKFNYSPVN